MFKISKATITHYLKEIIITVLLVGLVLNLTSYLRQPKMSDTALPSLSLEGISGKSIDLSHFKGKPLVIHFWATWCPTCKLETSNINNLSKNYNVITVAVNSGSNQKIQEFLKQKGVDFEVVNDTQGVTAKAFNVEVFPTTFFYDATGNLAFIEVGYTTEVGLEARMQWLENR